MTGLALVAMAFGLLLGLTPFSRFFGFDFLAELFVFGVFGLAAFAFVVIFGFFGRVGFILGVVAFAVVRFGFVVAGGEDEGRRVRRAQNGGMRRGGRGEQQQRGEQQNQQDRQFAHRSLIGARRGPC